MGVRKNPEQQTIVMLKTSLPDSVKTLKEAVTRHIDWRISAGLERDLSQFIIEKPVEYDIGRGWIIHATHRITGSFHTAQHGGSILQYRVTGQGMPSFFQAAMHVGVLAVIAVPICQVLVTLTVKDSGIGIFGVVALLVAAIICAVYDYRSYRNHVRELNRFMAEFAQQVNEQTT